MTTLYRLGNRIINFAHVEEFNLDYDPRKYDKHRPPSDAPGLEIMLASGRGVILWGKDAEVLRAFLAGEEGDWVSVDVDDEMIVIDLRPEAKVPAATAT